jgi:hypothetical protein
MAAFLASAVRSAAQFQVMGEDGGWPEKDCLKRFSSGAEEGVGYFSWWTGR